MWWLKRTFRTTVEALLQRDYKPTRTVVLAFGFDEESGGTYVSSACSLCKALINSRSPGRPTYQQVSPEHLRREWIRVDRR